MVGVGSLAACTKQNDAVCDKNAYCPNPARPYCDLDGAVDGTPNACIAIAACNPGDVIACSQDPIGTAILCNATGDGYDQDACANGCDPSLGCKPCKDGEQSCAADGTAVVQCDATGHQQPIDACSNGCENAACLPCLPDSLSCGTDGNVYQCDAHGVPQLDHDCDHGCLNATCKACETDARSCSAAGNLQKCDSAGVEHDEETCAAGCVPGAAPHCAFLQPEFVPGACTAPATTDLNITTSTAINLADDTVCNGGKLDQPGETDRICILHYKNITVAAGATLTFTNGILEVVALVADESITIDGTIDVGASRMSYGVGALGGNSNLGGGGAKTYGAGVYNQAGTFQGGQPMVLPPQTTLHGGTGGGGFGTEGGGGGGITIVACRGTLRMSSSAVIASSGGGGRGGYHMVPAVGPPKDYVGGSGGSGGVIVLQAVTYDIDHGRFFANGGAGASGMSADHTAGVDGQNGLWSTQAAIGGSRTTPAAPAGGNGGIDAAGPNPGTRAPSTDPAVGGTPGGGGGSVGYVILFAPSKGVQNLQIGSSSPMPAGPSTSVTQ